MKAIPSVSASAQVRGPDSGNDLSELVASDGMKDQSGPTSETVLGKRRAQTPLEDVRLPDSEDDDLSDADGEGEWDYECLEEQQAMMLEALASNSASLISEPVHDPPVHPASPQSGSSSLPVPPTRRQRPRTRAFPRTEESDPELNHLPNKIRKHVCMWKPLGSPNHPACNMSFDRVTDLSRHQTAHRQKDLDYARGNLGPSAVAEAQAAFEKCPNRAKPSVCEWCNQLFSRRDALRRHQRRGKNRCQKKHTV